MSEQTNTITRRDFLKGAAYASVLSVGSFSGLASADSISDKQPSTNEINAAANLGLMTITVKNQSDKNVFLDPLKPVSLEKVNGWFVVKINKAKPGDSEYVHQMVLTAGQEGCFSVSSELPSASSAHIVITNEFSTLDNILPIVHTNSMVA